MDDSELTPNIVTLFDDTKLIPGGGAKPITRLRFMLGHVGPFDAELPREHTDADVRRVMDDRRRAYLGMVAKP